MAKNQSAPSGQSTEAKTIRCAIYTRKSTDEHINAEFTSLDSQREYCQAFVKSREGEGWRVCPEEYSDAGFSGGNIDRPGLKKLLADAKLGKFQAVVCYKYDRLSRNTKDFLHILEAFDSHGVHFVSVTQPIDTTSSVGRLMRNILMEFAQFEREIISERTRDKMAAIVGKGRRAGGFPILGYDIDPNNKHLVVHEDEAEVARDIFRIYARSQSLSKTARLATEKGYRIKTWVTKNEKRQRGGTKINKATLQYMLRNPVYIGKVRWKGQLHPGAHKGIIPEDLFEKVGILLAANCHSRLNCDAKKRPRIFILKGLIRCAQCGAMMSPHFNGKGICHYRCSRIGKLDKSACPSKSVNAEAIERVILDRMSHLAKDKDSIEGIVQRAKANSSGELPIKRQEVQNLEKQAARVASEIQRMVNAIARGGGDGDCLSLIQAIKAKEAEKAVAQDNVLRVEREIQKLEGQQIEADIIRNNLGRFGALFQEMVPDERRRLAQLFLREVRYDGIKGRVRIELRALPAVEALLDLSENGSKVVKIGCLDFTTFDPFSDSWPTLVDEFYCGILKGRHGKPRLLFGNALAEAHAKAPKRVEKPPRIQGILRHTHEYSARLAAAPGLTRAALAREVGISPTRMTMILHLVNLAPEIQHHLLALPPSIHRGVVTEHCLRLIAKVPDHREQVARFQELLRQPVRSRQTFSPVAVPALPLGANGGPGSTFEFLDGKGRPGNWD